MGINAIWAIVRIPVEQLYIVYKPLMIRILSMLT